jgi:hypothetical protein
LVPERKENVVAVASANNGTAEVRIIQKSPVQFSFEIVAWTNFEDAGGKATKLETAFILTFGWAWLFGGNFFYTVLRFPRFLRNALLNERPV